MFKPWLQVTSDVQLPVSYTPRDAGHQENFLFLCHQQKLQSLQCCFLTCYTCIPGKPQASSHHTNTYNTSGPSWWRLPHSLFIISPICWSSSRTILINSDPIFNNAPESFAFCSGLVPAGAKTLHYFLSLRPKTLPGLPPDLVCYVFHMSGYKVCAQHRWAQTL